MAGQTVDIDAVASVLRLRFLLYRSVAETPTLAERLSGGLHIGTPPDTAAYPYGAFRVLNVRRGGIDAPFYTADVEVLLFYQPRAQGRALQQATDVVAEAGEGFRDLAAGVSQMVLRDADVLPPFSEAADPEVIQSRTTFALLLFPAPLP